MRERMLAVDQAESEIGFPLIEVEQFLAPLLLLSPNHDPVIQPGCAILLERGGGGHRDRRIGIVVHSREDGTERDVAEDTVPASLAQRVVENKGPLDLAAVPAEWRRGAQNLLRARK